MLEYNIKKKKTHEWDIIEVPRINATNVNI